MNDSHMLVGCCVLAQKNAYGKTNPCVLPEIKETEDKQLQSWAQVI